MANIKFKKILKEAAWDHTSGKSLPTLEDVKKAYDEKKAMQEQDLKEGLKSNIMQKWDKTDTMINDMRQFILSAKDAGGSDLLRDIADALKVMSNYAMGEYKKSK
tara:strand:- start:1151 stop:1465 length:315 start_codon:yes stop_codon:yes gene_type:complete